MTDDPMRYVRNPDFIFRQIVDEMILVPIHKNTADMDSIFSLNEVGGFIWGKLEQPSSAAELAAAIQAEYETTAEGAVNDLRIFLDQMIDIGAILRI